MEKIDFNGFKKHAKELEKSDICLQLQMMVKTEIKLEKVEVSIENYTLTLCSKYGKKIEIDLNYVANFYANQETLKLELDSIGSIIIYKNSDR